MSGNVRVTAEDWNAAIGRCGQLVPVAGRGIFIKRGRSSNVVALDELYDWRHPWHTVARWIGEQWQLTIKPGFVNGDPPIVVGSAPKPKKKGDVQEPDYEMTKVEWWPVVATRQVLEGVPAFFQAMGVEDQSTTASEVTAGNFDRINVTELLARSGASRILHSCEIFLTIARPQLVTNVTAIDYSGTSGALLQYQAGYDFAAVNRTGAKHRLQQGTEFIPNQIPNAGLRLLGIEPDESEDRLRVATVYFVSPDGEDKELPNDRWTAYVKHHVFWNLNYSIKNVDPGFMPPRPPFFSGLVGGYGDLIINQFSALQESVVQNASGFLREDNPAGVFWTT